MGVYGIDSMGELNMQVSDDMRHSKNVSLLNNEAKVVSMWGQSSPVAKIAA